MKPTNSLGVRRISIAKENLVTVFVHIVRLGDSPAEQEVAAASSDTHGNKQPSVESHRDQHEEITKGNLNDVQE